MQKELDLNETLRPGLDILANEIVIALKKRSRYKQNLEIYEPGLVIKHSDLSLLEYELARVERLHAELGRYTYANQEAFTDVGDVKLIIKRTAPESPICNFPTSLGGEVIHYYINWIKKYCEVGTDSDTFGETVTSDVAALMNLLERINLGKYVAEYKYQENKKIFQNTMGEPREIKELVVNKEREAKVLDMAAHLAEQYEFSADQSRKTFRWIIEETIKVEVEYIHRRLGINTE
jgi:chorismate mutase